MDDASRRQYLRRSLLVGAAMLGGCLAEETPTEGGATPTETNAGGTREPTPTTVGPETTTGHDTPTPTDPATPSGEGLEWWVDRGAPVTATPAVADGTVYAGTEDGTVSAHASDTGETTWEHEADEQIQELTVGEGHVLAVSGTTELSAGQELYALDAAAGGADRRHSEDP